MLLVHILDNSSLEV